MTFNETITTFIIMILITLMTLVFNYEPSNNDSLELQKDAERLELELKKEAIREKINLQYNK